MKKEIMNYVVIDKRKKECICTMNRISIAEFLKVSSSTVYRMLKKDGYVNTKDVIIFRNVPIVKCKRSNYNNFGL